MSTNAAFLLIVILVDYYDTYNDTFIYNETFITGK